MVVMHMLSRVYGVGSLKRFVPTPYSTQSEVFEGFTQYFVEVVSELISKGLRFGYIRLQGSSKVLRGRLLLKELYQHRYLFGAEFPCEYEVLCEDRLENRIIRAALDYVSRFPLNRSLRIPLRYALGLFDKVPADYDISGSSVDNVIYTRLNEHYRHALSLCRLVLDRIFIAFSSGGTQFYSFLVDMNKLFEEYVIDLLSDNLGSNFSVRTRKFSIEGDPDNVVKTLTLEPDFIIEKPGGPVLAGEVKYKVALVETQYSSEQLRNQDFYQALAYSVVTRVPAMLIYPAHAIGHRLADIFKLPQSTVAVATLDLSVPVAELGTDISGFAESLLEEQKAPLL